MRAKQLTSNYGNRERRAKNILWTAAGDYQLQPAFLAYDKHGHVDVYFNTILGLVYRRYGEIAVNQWYWELGHSLWGYLLIDLFWLGLEKGIYEYYQGEYPGLKALRNEWADNFLQDKSEDSMQYLMMRQELSYTMKKARCREICHLKVKLLNPWERGLYHELYWSGQNSLEVVQEQFRGVIKRYFLFTPQRALSPQGWSFWGKALLNKLLRKVLPHQQALQTTSTNTGTGPMVASNWEIIESEPQGNKTLEKLKQQYQKILLSEQERLQWERELCQDIHRYSHIFLGQGWLPNHDQETASEVSDSEIEMVQPKKHLLEIRRLTALLENILLLARATDCYRAKTGKFVPQYVWQAEKNNDNRVFVRETHDPESSLKVILLLDGSDSRSAQKNIIAVQSYIVSKSMENCHIDNILMTYYTSEGYTVLEQLKDLQEPAEKAFDFHAGGWNRDGLAIRTIGQYIKTKGWPQVLLLMLTDIMPNDDHGIPVAGVKIFKSYSEEAAIEDTARELKALRKQGISVAGIINTVAPFDSSVARKMFNKQYIHLRKIDNLAIAVSGFVEQHLGKKL